jgi:hypothetical protein
MDILTFTKNNMLIQTEFFLALLFRVVYDAGDIEAFRLLTLSGFIFVFSFLNYGVEDHDQGHYGKS